MDANTNYQMVPARAVFGKRPNDPGDSIYYAKVIPAQDESGGMYEFEISDMLEPCHAWSIDEWVDIYLESHSKLPVDGVPVELPRECFESLDATPKIRRLRYSHLIMELGKHVPRSQ